MNFSSKALAFVSGSAFIALGINKLFNICQMHPHNPTGAFEYEGNRNCNLAGKGNQGRITGNHSAKISCENSTVEIMNNSNIQVDIIRFTFNAFNQLNSKISASESKIEMKSDKNVNISAKDAWCKFEDNKNVDFKGEGGANEYLSQFVGNLNGKFSGKNNQISAFNNKNLDVKGDNNNLEIADTRNHKIQPASVASIRNTLSIKRNGENSIQFIIEYVHAAKIKASKYALGIIEFRIVEDNSKVNLTLEEVEDIIYSVVDTKPSAIIIRAERNEVMNFTNKN